jgi:hypothetical protein
MVTKSFACALAESEEMVNQSRIESAIAIQVKGAQPLLYLDKGMVTIDGDSFL